MNQRCASRGTCRVCFLRDRLTHLLCRLRHALGTAACMHRKSLGSMADTEVEALNELEMKVIAQLALIEDSYYTIAEQVLLASSCYRSATEQLVYYRALCQICYLPRHHNPSHGR